MALASFLGGSEFATPECPGPCSSPPVNQTTETPRMEVSNTQEHVIEPVPIGHPPINWLTAGSHTGEDRRKAVAPRWYPRKAPSPTPRPKPTTSASLPEATSAPPVPSSSHPPTTAAPQSSPTVAVAKAMRRGARAQVETEAQDVEEPAAPSPCVVHVGVEPSLHGPASVALDQISAAAPLIDFVLADTGPVTISHGGEWPTDPVPFGWTAPDRRTILINADHPFHSIDEALAEVIAHELGHVLIGPDHVHDGTLLDPRLDGRINIGPADHAVLSDLTCSDLGL